MYHAVQKYKRDVVDQGTRSSLTSSQKTSVFRAQTGCQRPRTRGVELAVAQTQSGREVRPPPWQVVGPLSDRYRGEPFLLRQTQERLELVPLSQPLTLSEIANYLEENPEELASAQGVLSQAKDLANEMKYQYKVAKRFSNKSRETGGDIKRRMSGYFSKFKEYARKFLDFVTFR
jgi:hypothetical protein